MLFRSGETTEQTTKFAHERLPTFGVGREKSRNEWRSIFRQLYATGILSLDITGFCRWSVTDRGRDVLRGKATIPLREEVVTVGKKAARELAAEMLAKVGLSDKLDSYPSQLSGGQQQRVAIARALAMRPKVLLCDEITSALDPELVNEVLRVVEQLAREGMTLMLVTHEMRFARDVGTSLVFMHHGKVHEQGAPKNLFAAPKTPELQQFIGSIS